MRKILLILSVFTVFSLPASAAEDEIPPAFRSTGYPIPRFVSLNKDEAFVRSGPAQHYPVKWVYRRAGLPVEIILEFENWRKVRDIDGHEGWVFYSLLSGNRTGIIKDADTLPMLKKPKTDSPPAAYLEKGVIVKLEECGPLWCKIKAGGEASDVTGWIQRKYIWGIYESENFD
ncbi:MAG: SH3 domain-containing protein [Alphaproteobacteria bacterium]